MKTHISILCGSCLLILGMGSLGFVSQFGNLKRLVQIGSQETVDAAVAHLFTQTNEVELQRAATATIEAAFYQALKKTAAPVESAAAATGQSLEATRAAQQAADAQMTAVHATQEQAQQATLQAQSALATATAQEAAMARYRKLQSITAANVADLVKLNEVSPLNVQLQFMAFDPAKLDLTYSGQRNSSSGPEFYSLNLLDLTQRSSFKVDFMTKFGAVPSLTALSANGTTLVLWFGYGGALMVYDVPSQTQIAAFKVADTVESLVVSASGDVFAYRTKSQNGSPSIVAVAKRTGEGLGIATTSDDNTSGKLVISGDGNTIISVPLMTFQQPITDMQIWILGADHHTFKLPAPQMSTRDNSEDRFEPAVTLSDNGRIMVMVTDQALTTWDLETGQKLTTVKSPDKFDIAGNPLRPLSGQIRLTSDGSAAAYLVNDGTIRFYDTHSGSLLARARVADMAHDLYDYPSLFVFDSLLVVNTSSGIQLWGLSGS